MAKQTAYELTQKLSKFIGDEAASKLFPEMNRIKNEAFKIMRDEGISEEGFEALKELFINQFRIGFKASKVYCDKHHTS